MLRYQNVAARFGPADQEYVVVSYPEITVRLTGTNTLATLFQDASGVTPLTNPFTGDQYGQFFFYAAPGVGYDVTVGNGVDTDPNVIPYTLGDVQIGESPDTDVIFPESTFAGLPAPGTPGHAYLLTDRTRGIWIDQGNQFFGANGLVANVREFGAVGNGTTDDTTAIQSAINAVSALGGGIVYFPTGRYRITATLTWANVGMRLTGAGPELSVLLKTNDGGAIRGTYAAFYTGSALIDHLTIATTVLSTGTAIEVIFPSESSVAQITAEIRSVQIRSEPLAAPGVRWLKGIALTCAWLAVLEDIHISGDTNNASPDVGTRGVSLYGRFAGVLHHGVAVWSMELGFEIYQGEVQGITWRTCQAIGGRIGLWANCDPALPQPQITVDGCHFNCTFRGIVLSAMDQSSVTNNLIYGNGTVLAPFTGIDVQTDAQYTRVIGNHLVNIAASKIGTFNTGIAIGNAGHCVVMGNSSQDVDVMVYFSVNATRCVAMGNIRDGGSITVLDSGANDIVVGNNPP